jgi:hypothetical protein
MLTTGISLLYAKQHVISQGHTTMYAFAYLVLAVIVSDAPLCQWIDTEISLPLPLHSDVGIGVALRSGFIILGPS